MSGTLYIIGVPIGNSEDISLRAIKILQQLEILACEDTRDTRRLLNELKIEGTKQLISYFEHNEKKKADEFIELLLSGKDMGLVSSRGMPLVSDPGYLLIQKAISNGISLKVIPGPAAFLTGLMYSGFPLSDFIFLGFPPKKPGKQKKYFEQVMALESTLVFYDSPRRLVKTLTNLSSLFGEWNIAICRELTKTYEEILRGNFLHILDQVTQKEVKGEVVVVLSHFDKSTSNTSLGTLK